MGQSILELLGEYYFWGLVGFTLGSILVIYDLTKNGATFPFAVLFWTIVIYAGLAGTRILFVLGTDPGLFTENLPLALVFWQGHLSWQGGPVLGTLVAILVLAALRKPIWSTIGSTAPGLALCHALARVACLVTGCCYGAPTAVPWAIYSRQANAMVHPTQAYSMMAELATAVLLQLLWRRPERRRYLMPLYGVLLGSHRLVTEAFRGTPPGPELLPGLRFYQSTSLLLIVGSLCLLALLHNKKLGAACTIAATLLLSGALVAFHARPQPAPLPPQPSHLPYLVITRAPFVEGLTSWRERRERQGYEVVVGAWDSTPTQDELQTWIRTHAAGGCSNILLIGDCRASEDSGAPEDPEPPWHIPSCPVAFEDSHARRKQGLSDALYGDLDGDQVPDVPVGRLPVHDKKELKSLLRKIAKYEKPLPQPIAPRALVWTGAKSYQEAMYELTVALLEEVPPWLDTYVLSAYDQSEHYEYPPEQPKRFLEQMSRPAALSLLVGHGSFRHVQFGEFEEQKILLAVEDVTRLTSLTPNGPLFVLACSTGNFARPSADGPSLAEAFLAHPGGPIAVASSSLSVEALTNYFTARALSQELAQAPKTTGQLLLATQRKLCAQGDLDFETLSASDALAQRLLDALPNPEKESPPGVLHKETLTLNLLGDPATLLQLSALSSQLSALSSQPPATSHQPPATSH